MSSPAAPASPASSPSLLAVPVTRMRAPVEEGTTRPLAWRRAQLARLEALLADAETVLPQALADDLGKPAVEAWMEGVSVRHELRHTRRHLAHWARPRSVALPLWLLPGQGAVHLEPLGCVLIVGPWNYPFQLCLRPLVSALAAGNTAVIKPSEYAPRTAETIASLVPRHFPPEIVQVVTGDADVGARLLEERFDHIFFTGSTRVGRLVMAAAARQLTPVTLELGGKSPAVVLDDADVVPTARRLVWGKGMNAGQTCLAPDHLLVQPGIRGRLLEAMAREGQRLYGDDPLASPDLARIVDARQFERLEALLQTPRLENRILMGGRSDAAGRRIEPTLIRVDRPDEDPLMQEELFGPLLPVIEVTDLDEALAQVRRRPSPLALYLFGGGSSERRRLLEGSRSGSVVFGDVILQAAAPGLPFGGVGESGMGGTHGETGFRTFSQVRSVLNHPTWLDLPLRYPPYAGRLGWLQRLMG
ncbi:aldehyde dehydrogenase family protein [Cyanobium sp. FGCU-6]|nr:aldehyde dehydrogenase family protein [Cyanobium sp. FGCU6]